MRAYLELVRLPNLLTAIADVMAGFAYGGGRVSDWKILVELSLASVCLYAGGVALNDVCDAAMDEAQRPDRPIPSGRISIDAAKRLTLAALTLGVALATWASVPSGAVAAALVVCVVLYNVVLKGHAVAPAIMGFCRALNFCLPLAGLGVITCGDGYVLPLAAVWLYVTSLTFFARDEAVGGRRPLLVIGTVGGCVSVAILAGLHWTLPTPHDAFLVAVAVVTILVAYLGGCAVKRPTPASIQRATRRFVMLLVGVDLCIAWASRGTGAAAAVACILILVMILGSPRMGMRVT